VLHARPLHPLATREPFYVGAELFGHESVAADGEVLELAVRSLALVQVQGLRFDLGHTRILRALLEIDPAAQRLAEDIVAALSAKDAPALAPLTAEIAAPARSALRALLRLHGDEHVLAAARAVLPRDRRFWRRSTSCSTWSRCSGGSARRSASTSPTCTVPLPHRRHLRRLRRRLAGGARPRRPLRRHRAGFRQGAPATGFSIDLRELARLHEGTAAPSILAPAGDDPALAALVEKQRAAGQIVVRRLGETTASMDSSAGARSGA